jgi:hypothetical protein
MRRLNSLISILTLTLSFYQEQLQLKGTEMGGGGHVRIKCK